MEPARILVAIILALAACTPPGDTAPAEEGSPALSRRESALDAGTPPCPTPGGTCVPVSAPIPVDAACPGTRWIAVLTEGLESCPTGPSTQEGYWAMSRLFGATTQGWAVPPGLAGFCAYDWVPAEKPLPSQQAMDGLRTYLGSRAARLDRDCQVVAPLGTSATVEAAWQTLRKDFHAQTGRLPLLPPGETQQPVAVRVAVVDSAPHRYTGGEAVEDRLGHGFAMGRVIRELGCPDGSPVCIAQVAHHLALPQVTPSVRDLAHGGYFGEQTQLARAIHVAVSEWRDHNAGQIPAGEPTAPQPRLVVNLSLAWDGRYGGPYSANQVEQLPAPVRAVHAAITHAVCRGGVVIAAAGNDPGGAGDVTGPMFPAGWEQKPAPGLAACGLFEGPGYPEAGSPPLFPPAAVYQPLVYAVGGVRGDDAPLASTRPGGRPRLAAPGAHALAADVDSTGSLVPTDLLTGTSVSTAVVSGIAATVWGYRPLLSGAELMDGVRQGSVDLGTPADFCLGGRPCPWSATDARRAIARVSLCGALTQACAGSPGRCPSALQLPKCAPRPAHGSPLPQLDTVAWAFIESRLTRKVDGARLDVVLPPLPVCRQSALRSSRWLYEETVCPFRQYDGIALRPWTNPQPSKNPCSLCLLESDPLESLAPSPTATLYISIDSEYSPRTMDSPSLLINGRYEVDLSALLERAGQTTLTAGDEVQIIGIPLDPAWLPIESATLTLRGEALGEPYSTSSELLLQ